MSTHTPGPWKLHRTRSRFGLNVVAERGASCICEMPSWDDEYIPERDANARLIAAAPEMLEALESAAAHCTDILHDPKWHPVRHCPVLDQIQSVIAKAKGKA